MRSQRRLEAGIGLALLLLPLLWFFAQAFGGKTLLPVDNLFAFEPWKSFSAQLGVGTPHNSLLSDLILENYAWKSFIREALSSGHLTDLVWNPRLFAGAPFLAAGQHSALYPLSVIFYALPLWQAYGVFTWLQLALALIGMYVFARVLGLAKAAAAVSAVAFAFSGFFIVSVTFTMIIAAAAWLPLILAMIELKVRKQEQKGSTAYSPVPYVAAGALYLGVQILAGHVEITYYTLLVSAFYAAWRLFGAWRRLGRWRPLLRLAGWVAVMFAVGLALGAVQLLPLYELVSQSFRQGAASLHQVREWAWPSRQIITFILPDFFGNPSHHNYFDIWARIWRPVTQNSLGQPLDTIDWGVKNYVEGGNYLGIVTLLLALFAALSALLQRSTPVRQDEGQGWTRPPTGRFYVAGFALLAVLSLLFAFGTPLYGVLYYLIPGYSQLHSAFRWVFPYTLSMAVLAGFGVDWLLRADIPPRARRVARMIGAAAVLCGLAALAAVGLSLVWPAWFVAIGDKLLQASDLARERAFSDGAVAWSYEASGLGRFGVIAVLAGGLLFAAGSRPPDPSPRRRLAARAWKIAVLVLLISDLWLFGHGFNTAADPELLAFKPPVITWLQDHADPVQPWRLTTFDFPGDATTPAEKLLNANSAMPYGLEDIRGYDSIIPKPYVALMERIQQQGDLLYNRVAPIYMSVGGQPNYDALDNPLLRLLGVRYVMTTHAIPNAGYELAYDKEVKVYENRSALPRAFIASKAVAAPDQAAALDALQKIDPAAVVVVEGSGSAALPPPSSPQNREARISKSGAREIFVDVNLSDRGWLVLTDNFFEGWKAYVRPFGVTGEGINSTGQSVEQQLPIYRADGAFRTVYLDKAGQWTVRFVYSPRSLVLGLYISFLAVITLILLAGWWAWGRYYRGESSEVGTVAKNSAVQMIMSLMNKGIDFVFAMLRLRILSPAGEGSYVFAITFYGFFEIVTRYGLGTLLTRDIALDRQHAERYLVNVIWLRTLLWLASLPVMIGVMLLYRMGGQLSMQEAQAIGFFAAALFFANLADAISAVFIAFEKMEYPAGTATAVAVGKVALGALILLPPFDKGFVGLSVVSLVMNIVQAAWLYWILRRTILPRRRREVRPTGAQPVAATQLSPQPASIGLNSTLQREMMRESGPLMINNLLASVFWRVDLWLLKAFAGAAAVGIFSAGVKYLDGLNVIPAYFTLSIFPLMSRYARNSGDSLARAYRLAVQLLFIISLPIAVFFTFAATPLIRILGGAAYLPDSAIALRLMIWSVPIGFVNSVTQYALIAVKQQRFLTKAFLVGVVFNTVANLVLVPRYGYAASAALLLPAELALFIPFYWAVRRYVTPMPWFRLGAIPMLATALNAAAVWSLERAGLSLVVALAVGFLIYVAALTAAGTFRGDDFDVLRSRFPKLGLRRAIPRV